MSKHPLQPSGNIKLSDLVNELSGNTSTTLTFSNVSLSGLCWGIPKLKSGNTPNINPLNNLTNIQSAPYHMSYWYGYNHALVEPYITGPFGNTGTTTGMQEMGYHNSFFTIDNYGVCWNTTGSPTIEDSSNSYGAGVYDGVNGYITPWTISPLSINTLYYIKAWCHRTDGGEGVASYWYGSELTYTPVQYFYTGYTVSCNDCGGDPLMWAPSQFTSNDVLTIGWYKANIGAVHITKVNAGDGGDGDLFGLIGPYDTCVEACPATTTTTSTTVLCTAPYITAITQYSSSAVYLYFNVNAVNETNTYWYYLPNGGSWTYGGGWASATSPKLVDVGGTPIGYWGYKLINLCDGINYSNYSNIVSYFFGETPTTTTTTTGVGTTTTTTTSAVTTTTTTTCTRGLAMQEAFIAGWTMGGIDNNPFSSWSVSNVYASFTTFKNLSYSNPNTEVYYRGEFESLTINKDVYNYSYPTGCIKIPDGNYWYNSLLSIDPELSDVHTLSSISVVTISSGKISAIYPIPD